MSETLVHQARSRKRGINNKSSDFGRASRRSTRQFEGYARSRQKRRLFRFIQPASGSMTKNARARGGCLISLPRR